jgi:hypothetical protein
VLAGRIGRSISLHPPSPLKRGHNAMATSTGQNTHRDANKNTHAECIQACAGCATACELCLASMLDMLKGATAPSDTDPQSQQSECPKCCIVCAAICQACIRVLSTDSPFAKDMCDLCAKVCDWCEQECRKEGHDHCLKCAEACEACARACRAVA